MPRFIRDFRLKEPPEQSFAAISQFLTMSGFVYQTLDGENIFKKGDGWVSAPTCIKVTYGPEAVRLEGWLKYAILPGVYGGDLGRSGFVGCAVKGNLKSCFDWCQNLLGGDAYALCPGFDGEPRSLPPITVIDANGRVKGAQNQLPGYVPQGGAAPVQAMPAPQQQYLPPAQQYIPPQQQYVAPGQQQYAPPAPMMHQPAAVVYCVHCGQQIAHGSGFCIYCGKPQQ